MPQLDQAQDLRAEAANSNLATFEILQIAELPLHVPTKNTSTIESPQPLSDEQSNTDPATLHWFDRACEEMKERIKANNAEDAEIANHKGRMSPTIRDSRYRLFVDDNFHYMDESERYLKGTYETEQEAVAVAKRIVDEFLLANQYYCKSATELDELYREFGHDPFIISDSKQASDFSAWQYSAERCRELFALEPTEWPSQDSEFDEFR